MHHEKKLSFILMGLSVVLCGQEILKNGNYDDKSLWREASLSQKEGHFSASKFTEDQTGNNCLKLELKKLVNGQVGCILLIGKDGKKTGFPAKPETTYEFSFEVKGTVPNVICGAVLYHTNEASWKPGASKRIKTTLNGFQTPAEWTQFKGSFRTEKNTIRAVLILQLWANEERAKNWHPGQYLLLDKVSIREQKTASQK